MRYILGYLDILVFPLLLVEKSLCYDCNDIDESLTFSLSRLALAGMGYFDICMFSGLKRSFFFSGRAYTNAWVEEHYLKMDIYPRGFTYCGTVWICGVVWIFAAWVV